MTSRSFRLIVDRRYRRGYSTNRTMLLAVARISCPLRLFQACQLRHGVRACRGIDVNAPVSDNLMPIFSP